MASNQDLQYRVTELIDAYSFGAIVDAMQGVYAKRAFKQPRDTTLRSLYLGYAKKLLGWYEPSHDPVHSTN